MLAFPEPTSREKLLETKQSDPKIGRDRCVPGVLCQRRMASMKSIIHANANNIVGDFRVPIEGRKKVWVEPGPAHGSQVDIKVFNFPRPIHRARDSPFDPSTQGPSEIRRRAAERPSRRHAGVSNRSSDVYSSVR